MKQLMNLQNQFQNFLTQDNAEIISNIMGTAKVSREKRMDIYKEAYRLRLIEALTANFPILEKYLGYEQFNKLANGYIDAYPSEFRSIRWFGDRLDLFLNENEPYHVFPYLSEFANLEWCMTLSFDAREESVITLGAIGEVAPHLWETMRFRLHHSIHLLTFNWNVVDLWKSLSQDETPPDPVKQAPQSWILWRQNLINRYCLLPTDEHLALASIAEGKKFGEVCELLSEWSEDPALKAASLLKGWIEAGLIIEIIV
jgi:hypothetical protein